ncbi:MAG: hypothetical protein ACYTG0_16995 [Planctomycetota bacterium]|jgi:hypothetical protein
MSAHSERDREDRALDALIASQLRWEGDRDKSEKEHLPQLTEADCRAMDALGEDLVERLLAGEVGPAFDCESSTKVESADDEALVGAGDASAFGFNRASSVDHEVLDQKRRELLERLRSERKDDESKGGQSRP